MKPKVKVLSLALSMILLFTMGFAQSPEIVEQRTDSVVHPGEDLIEQQSDEDPTAENSEDFDFTVSLRSRLIRREQPAAGYSNGYYSGSADKLYERCLYRIGEHVAGGFLMEKDAGESKIYSFTTMNISFQDVCPIVKKLVLGDYRIESGQGLTLWSGRGFLKGADVVTPLRRKPRGIVSALSSDEFHFFRGAGTEITWQSITTVLFYSSIRRSAVLDDSGDIISFNENGYYRTTRELQQLNNTDEKVIGGRFIYRLPFKGVLGLTFLSTKYSRGFAVSDNVQNTNGAAIDFSCSMQRISLCGELAHANNRSAGIVGVFLHPHKNINIVMSYRFYPDKYLPVRTLPFGEWGSGERGFYCGFTAEPWKSVALSVYYDQFEKIKGGDFSTEGNDFLINVKIPLYSRLSITAQYRRKMSEYTGYHNDPGMLQMRSTRLNCRQKFRITAEHKVSSYLSLRARLEENFFSNGVEVEGERGFLFYNDITVKAPKNWLFSVRITYFRSFSRETVPYELERDLDGVLTQTMLTGEGNRFYLLAGYDAVSWLKISGKYSVVQRDDVLKIGSGHDQLPSNRDSRISVQVDILL